MVIDTVPYQQAHTPDQPGHAVLPLHWLQPDRSMLMEAAVARALAADPAQPLLERCKFLAIFSSNLDEFFMVRVAGVMDALEAGRPSSTPAPMSR